LTNRNIWERKESLKSLKANKIFLSCFVIELKVCRIVISGDIIYLFKRVLRLLIAEFTNKNLVTLAKCFLNKKPPRKFRAAKDIVE
jgi:hypothetical protein